MSSRLPLKALILAAGLGSRLRPITEHTPKPLLPFFDEPLISWALATVKHANITDIAINTHHLADQLSDFVTAQRKGIFFSEETSELLGTGGAICKLAPWVGSDHLLIYNADIIANIDLGALIDQHFSSNATATMCLLSFCPEGKNPVYLDDSRVLGIGKDAKPSPSATKHTLACAHIISPGFMRFLPEEVGFFDIIDAYKLALSNKELISATIHEGVWFDLGTPKDFWLAHQYVLQQKDPDSFLKDLKRQCGLNTASPLKFFKTNTGFNVAADLKIVPHNCHNVVHLGRARLSEDCCWQNVLLLPDSNPPDLGSLENAIVFKDHIVSTS